MHTSASNRLYQDRQQVTLQTHKLFLVKLVAHAHLFEFDPECLLGVLQAPDPNKSFMITLSDPTGGVLLGKRRQVGPAWP